MDIATLIATLGTAVVLPCVCVGFGVWNLTNKTKKKTEIIMAAIEKNPSANMEDFSKSFDSQKSLKEKTLKKLENGLIFLAVGLGCLCLTGWLAFNGRQADATPWLLASTIPFFVGISYITVYFISKKELKKEIEGEEQQLLTKKQ